MKKTVLITGGNSFIAKHLIKILEPQYELKLLTRDPKANNEYGWDLASRTMDERALNNVNYIVHLAGAKLNDGTPLTEERKKLIRDTRIGAANFLRERLKARNQKLTGFVSASAIGYYGFTDATIEIDEEGEKGFGFSADLCEDWEKAADLFRMEEVAAHVAKIRVSLVLGEDGGIFPMYLNMLKNNPSIAGQPNQAAVPWNHVTDMAGIFAFAVEHHLDGVYNSVAPEAASQQAIFSAIAHELTGISDDVQPFAGQHLVSHKIVAAGYQFKFPNIKEAVANILAV